MKKSTRDCKKHGFEEAREVTYVKLPATQKIIMMFNSEREVPMAIISEKNITRKCVNKKRANYREVHNAPGSATMVITDMANELDENRSYETAYELKLTDKSSLFN